MLLAFVKEIQTNREIKRVVIALEILEGPGVEIVNIQGFQSVGAN